MIIPARGRPHLRKGFQLMAAHVTAAIYAINEYVLMDRPRKVSSRIIEVQYAVLDLIKICFS